MNKTFGAMIKELETPPTQIEIAEVLNVLSGTSAHDIIRRLVF